MRVVGRKLFAWTAICLAILVIAWTTSDRYFSRTVCYEPDLQKCMGHFQVPMDSSLIDRHLLTGAAREVFGVPLSWEISVEEIGSDYFAQEEILRFSVMKKKTASKVFGSVSTRIVTDGSRIVLEVHKEKESRTVWMILEKE